MYIAISCCIMTAGQWVLEAGMQLQVWGQLGWTSRSCMHMLGQIMGRQLHVWRQRRCG